MNKNTISSYIIKKYGPGFVAFSEKTGRILAYGRDLRKLYENADKKKIDYSKVIISHIPKYGTISLYYKLHGKS